MLNDTGKIKNQTHLDDFNERQVAKEERWLSALSCRTKYSYPVNKETF